ncbi:MAG: hypothetical protein Salg2KO_13230 [Salibacteraceae bacterium]
MIGFWTVVRIETQYVQSSLSGFSVDSTTVETGDLGFFEFDSDIVSYEFSRTDSMHLGTANWYLEAVKVNDGFTRVNQYNLTIENRFDFDVQFEDGTKNSQHKASNAELLQMPTSTDEELLIFTLEKQ